MRTIKPEVNEQEKYPNGNQNNSLDFHLSTYVYLGRSALYVLFF